MPIFTQYPAQVQAVHNPILVKATEEMADGGSVSLQISILAGPSRVFSREYFNGLATFNLGPYLRDNFATGTTLVTTLSALIGTGTAPVPVYTDKYKWLRYQIAGVDAVYKAINAVFQLGQSSRMTGLMGSFLTSQSVLYKYAGFPLLVSMLTNEGATDDQEADAVPIYINSTLAGEVPAVAPHVDIEIIDGVASISLDSSYTIVVDIMGDAIADIYGNILATGNAATVVQSIRVIPACTPANPFYVRWLSPLGGMEFFMFSRSQEVIDEVSNIATFEERIDNQETATRTTTTIGMDAKRTAKCEARGLNPGDFYKLRGLMYGQRLEYYNTELEAWQGIVLSKSAKLQQITWESLQIAQFEFILPTPQIMY